MNTYLWANENHFPYDFVAVNAATLEDAIKLATEVVESEFENKIQKDTTAYCELVKTLSKEHLDWLNRITKEIKEDCARYINIIIETQPIVLPPNTAKIIDHANE